MLSEWNRVRIAQWSKRKDVRVRKVTKRHSPNGKRFDMQMHHSLIGITVPVVHDYGIVVFPIEYMAGEEGQYGLRRANPYRTYYVVPERWVTFLGPVHDEELAIIKKACVQHGLVVETPEQLQLLRARDRFSGELDAVLQENQEADDRKNHLRKRRSGK
jgi:hypothetical protein